MAYLNQTLMGDFFRYYADEDLEDVTFVDTIEKTAFGYGSDKMFSVLELQDIFQNKDERYIAIYQRKENPTSDKDTGEAMDG